MSYARLHGDLVLPTIEELVGLDREPTDWMAETRIRTTASVRRIPTAQSIVESSVRHQVREPRLVAPPFPRTIAQTVRTRRLPPAIRWPVFLCGFVAGVFAGLAVLASPVAQTPSVARVVNAVSPAVHR